MTDPTITQTGDGFWTQNGGQVNRLERVFVGDARANDAAWPNVAQDWLSVLLNNGAISTAQFAVLSSNGQFGAVFASRSSDNNVQGSQSCIPLGFFAINDADAAHSSFAWGAYGEAHHYTGAAQTYGIELDIANHDPGAVSTRNPYNVGNSPGQTTGFWIASGAAAAGGAVYDATLALGVSANGAAFKAGLMFRTSSLALNAAGVARAVSMPVKYAIEWHKDASDTPCASVNSIAGNGVELYSGAQRCIETHAPVTGEAGMLLAVNKSGTISVVQVKIGAANSGGSGKRALVIDN